jgi:hypothetical protein
MLDGLPDASDYNKLSVIPEETIMSLSTENQMNFLN